MRILFGIISFMATLSVCLYIWTKVDDYLRNQRVKVKINGRKKVARKKCKSS